MKRRGFTLVELLIVVAIIGIVAAIAIPNLLTALEKGKQKATVGDMKTIGNGIATYRTAMNMVPNDMDMAGVLYLEPNFIKRINRRDGWGFNWHYIRTGGVGGTPDTYSLGSGGKYGVFTWTHTAGEYTSIAIADFEWDIIFSEGSFVYGPKTQ